MREGKWRAVAPFPMPVFEASVVPFGDAFLVIGKFQVASNCAIVIQTNIFICGLPSDHCYQMYHLSLQGERLDGAAVGGRVVRAQSFAATTTRRSTRRMSTGRATVTGQE